MVKRKTTKSATPPLKVLLVDDEAATMYPVLASALEPRGFQVFQQESPKRALRSIEEHKPEILLLDLHFPGDAARSGQTTGGKLLPQIRAASPGVAILVFTSRLDDLDIPEESFAVQPEGFFAKPDFSGADDWVDALEQALRTAVAMASVERADSPAPAAAFVKGRSAAMRKVLAGVQVAACSPAPVLVCGDPGTGKRLVARALHALSGRTGAFEYLDASALEAGAVMAELFGSEPGIPEAPSRLARASGGTLFIDEIQLLPPAAQFALVEVLQSGRLHPGRGARDFEIDVHLVAACSDNLSDLVAEGTLRRDLAYRLAGGHLIYLPTLRERLDDLPDLFEHFVAQANQSLGRHVQTVLRPEVRTRLEAHHWPGNVAELQATLHRAVAGTRSNVLLEADIQLLEMGRPAKEEFEPTPVWQPSSDGSGAFEALVRERTATLLSMPLDKRWKFLLAQGYEEQVEIIVEVARHLVNNGEKLCHKNLADELDLVNGDAELEKVRQIICDRINLGDIKKRLRHR